MIVNDLRPRPVVITGVGVASPVGIGKEAFWQNLLAGHSGIGVLKAFPNDQLPCKLAAEIEGFEPARYLRQKKLLKVMSRDIELGVAAAAMAVDDAGLARGQIDPDRLGVVFGAGKIAPRPEKLVQAAAACASRNETAFESFGQVAAEHVYPLWLLPQLPNMPACHVAIEHDARGPNNTITSREASALLALGEAVSTIQRGAADAMIVGACGSAIDAVDIARLSLFEGLSRHENPREACRPFDMRRDGCVLGEGAAAFLVESKDFALRRGASFYAEVLSVAGGCDGRDYLDGAAGNGLCHAIIQAMRRARLEPRELGHISAHGKSTPRDDLIEARAYHRSLGTAAEKIPVTALTSYFGTFDAGVGAVELAGSVLALRYGILPYTLNYEIPDPLCRLNVVHHEPWRLKTGTALAVNRTAMGQSAAAVLRAP